MTNEPVSDFFAILTIIVFAAILAFALPTGSGLLVLGVAFAFFSAYAIFKASGTRQSR